jgi:hypothetical protein
MSWRIYFLLTVLGLALAVGMASLQPAPGYMDADYYYAGGLRLASGHGFSEMVLWNYLDDPSGLPHASHAYWMPLASLLAAAGIKVFGAGSWWGARAGFLLVAGCIPALTCGLAWSLTARRDLSVVSGLLAVFSGFYPPFLITTDTFGLYMLLGGIFFLLLANIKKSGLVPAGLGLVAGLMHLSRTEGLLWLGLAGLAIGLSSWKDRPLPVRKLLVSFGLVLAGYLLIMLPWFVRNEAAFDSLLAPGGSKMLWLTSYNQLFSYPADRLSFAGWWDSGLAAILAARLWAGGMNLATLAGVQSNACLLPFMLAGLWALRSELRIRMSVLAWVLLFVVMTLVFPFAGARGGFYHSGAALQTVWWAVAPLGLDRAIDWAVRRRGWVKGQASRVFGSAFVMLSALLTVVIVLTRILGLGGDPAWGAEAAEYERVQAFLAGRGTQADAVVMVSNPPGFYLASGHPAIALPDGDPETLRAVADRYGASVVILEAGSMPDGLIPIYENPQGWSGLTYLGEVGAARVFAIRK